MGSRRSGRRRLFPYQAVFFSPIGSLGIRMGKGYLLGIDFLSSQSVSLEAQDSEAQLVLRWLRHYFQRDWAHLDIPCLIQGTPSQRLVWKALSYIPRGQVITYSALAKQLEIGPRVVARACRFNRWPLIIPCHRVIGKRSLGGYDGSLYKQSMKAWLLKHEGLLDNIVS